MARVNAAASSRFFTLLLLTINLVIYVLMMAVELSGHRNASLFDFENQAVLLDFGLRDVSLINHGQWWRLVTPMFIHLGLLHISFNMFALYQIGPIVEEVYGSQKFMLAYMLSGLIGNIGSYTFHIGGAGASGALFGLIGITAVYGYRAGGTFGRQLMKQMLFWAGLGLALGWFMHFDNVNHLGGLITGASLGYILAAEHPETVRGVAFWNGAALVSVALVAVCFVMVGVNYGHMQHGEDVIKLNRRVAAIESDMAKSLQWKAPSDGDPKQIASDLRRDAGDIKTIPAIDSRSDGIRLRLTDLAEKQASSLEAAGKNPTAGLAGKAEAWEQEQQTDQDYKQWLDGILVDYGLEYRAQPEISNPGSVK